MSDSNTERHTIQVFDFSTARLVEITFTGHLTFRPPAPYPVGGHWMPSEPHPDEFDQIDREALERINAVPKRWTQD